MTKDQAYELLTGRKARRKSGEKPKGSYVLVEGSGKLIAQSLTYRGGLGSFEGKAGTVRRNSKGGTVRMPNGRRRYRHEAVNEGIIAYKLIP